MKIFSSILSLLITVSVTVASFAQQAAVETIHNEVSMSDAEMNVHFLASDELLGRDTGTHELDIAAKYIATWFLTNGVEAVPGQTSYFQDVPFVQSSPPEQASFTAGDSVYTLNKDIVSLHHTPGTFRGSFIFLDSGSADEIENNDVKGKIVLSNAGHPDVSSFRELISASARKRAALTQAGAAGLIELYSSPEYSWSNITSFLGRQSLQLGSPGADAESIPHFWLNAFHTTRIEALKSLSGQTTAEIKIDGTENQTFTSRNVLGFIEGTDPDLKNETILLSAHYDHTGVKDGQPGEDTIFNGARDNAVGTSAIMQAAKYFAKNPPRRSLLVAAWTAEEKGLLGSRWFSEHPPIPLNQIVFNLNIDGAGYNDTTIVTVVGLGRTDADDQLSSAAEAFGLEAVSDPAPEQNLFDRSDNVNFARQGIPAPTYSLGFTAFDEEISHYYHRVTDEPDTIDYDYVTAYIRSYVLAVKKIADRDEAPFWYPGDVYEEAGIELYERK